MTSRHKNDDMEHKVFFAERFASYFHSLLRHNGRTPSTQHQPPVFEANYSKVELRSLRECPYTPIGGISCGFHSKTNSTCTDCTASSDLDGCPIGSPAPSEHAALRWSRRFRRFRSKHTGHPAGRWTCMCVTDGARTTATGKRGAFETGSQWEKFTTRWNCDALRSFGLKARTRVTSGEIIRTEKRY